MAAGQRRYQCRTTYRLFDPLLRAAIVQQILYSIFSINLDRAEQGIDTLGCLFGNLRAALPSFELLLAGRQKDPWSERRERKESNFTFVTPDMLRMASGSWRTCCLAPNPLGRLVNQWKSLSRQLSVTVDSVFSTMPTVLVVGTDPAATTATWPCLALPNSPMINDVSNLSHHRALSDTIWIWLFNESQSPYDIGIRDSRLLFRQPIGRQLPSILDLQIPAGWSFFFFFSSLFLNASR